MILHRLCLVNGLRRAREDDIKTAREWMKKHGHLHGHGQSFHHEHDPTELTTDTSGEESSTDSDFWEGSGEDVLTSGLTRRTCLPTWNNLEVENYVKESVGRCVLILDGWVIDVTCYLGEHVRVPIFSPTIYRN